jgi:ubiquinone/menaquinone biosynthesis C-methylase UbiE
MESGSNNNIKDQVKGFWNEKTCGTWEIDEKKFTRQYFQSIEEDRYSKQPEIFAFAQFTRFTGKKVLEVGIGAGTDFIQWARAGCEAYGIDLTEESIEHLKHRLKLEGLNAKEFKVADSESLPYKDDLFDLVYSWGVIHHTPDTQAALKELIRVCKPGGKCKIMIYHRRSLLAYFFWLRHTILKGKIGRSVKWALYNHMESIGTKAYTKQEVLKMLADQPVKNIIIKPVLSYYDRLERFGKVFQLIAKVFAYLLGGDRVGWFLTIEFDKDH